MTERERTQGRKSLMIKEVRESSKTISNNRSVLKPTLLHQRQNVKHCQEPKGPFQKSQEHLQEF